MKFGIKLNHMIKAEIVADSKNEFGNRITTFVLTMPRIVLAEFNTHRMISRNSASSRAIPFETIVKRVNENPFIPISWMKEHTGMQGNNYFRDEYIDGNNDTLNLQDLWLQARNDAIKKAIALSEYGLSKQFCNRLLEPYMLHTVVATSTEWENFFALRAHPMAEIHMQDLAFKMLDEYNKSEPELLHPGEWHIPFEDNMNEESLRLFAGADGNKIPKPIYKVMASAGICAGVSYGRIKDNVDIADMIDLHDSLVIRPYDGKRGIRTINDPIHASPTEHQAQAMTKDEINYFSDKKWVGKGGNQEWSGGWDGNFIGFKQYRKMLPNENASDSRVIKK